MKSKMRRQFKKQQGRPKPPASYAIQEQANAWVIRLDQTHCSFWTRWRFQRWLSRSQSHQHAFAQAFQLWHQLDAIALQHSFSLHSPVPYTTSTAKWRQTAIGLSCVSILGSLLVIDWSCWNQYCARTGVGEIQQVQLSQGAKMTLDAQSLVRIFHSDEVELLKGQAIFELNTALAQSLTIHVGEGKIHNQATELLVSKLDHEQAVILVAQGQATIRYGTEERTVSSGQKLHLLANKHFSQTRTIDPALALSWRSGTLLVQDEPLHVLLNKLSVYRNDYVLVLREELKYRRISGLFTIHDPEAALLAIQKTLNLHTWTLGPLTLLLASS